MIARLNLAYHMATEALARGEFLALLKRHLSYKRLLTPVEMDLSVSMPAAPPLPLPDLRFLELSPVQIQSQNLVFSLPSRRLKALMKIRQGFRGFAFVRDNTVIADVWCLVQRPGRLLSHPDLKLLGISCGEGEAYGFEMLIDPTYRGKNLAVPLQRALHYVLKCEGYAKMYGSYYDDNLPALWMHRMLKYRELPKRRVSRFVAFSSSAPAEQADMNTQRCAPKDNKS